MFSSAVSSVSDLCWPNKSAQLLHQTKGIPDSRFFNHLAVYNSVKRKPEI
jgi:hypothetical protein